MVEEERKIKSDKVRVPAALIAELRRIEGEYKMRGEQAPTYGEMIMKVWRSRDGKKKPAPADGGVTLEVYQAGQLSPTLRKCADILNGPDRAKAEALETLVEAWHGKTAAKPSGNTRRQPSGKTR